MAVAGADQLVQDVKEEFQREIRKGTLHTTRTDRRREWLRCLVGEYTTGDVSGRLMMVLRGWRAATNVTLVNLKAARLSH